MSMDYIRDTYKVTAKPGGRVEYAGSGKPKYGTIKSADGAHLRILLDGEKLTRKFHPTWEMRYLPDNVGDDRQKATVAQQLPADFCPRRSTG